MTEKEWLKQAIMPVLKAPISNDEKLETIIMLVESYNAMKEI